MKKINKLGYIAVGMVLALIISTVTPAFAASKDIIKQLTAYFTSGGKPINVYVNGDKLTKDSNGKAVTPFTADGVTYVPARAVAEALGKEVIWDGANASVKINDIKLNLPGSIKDENAKLTTTIDAKGERHDNLEYTFTLDKDAVGEWEYFNYYNDIENQFDPNSIPDAQYQSWKGLSIYNDGKTIMRMMNDGRPANRTDVSWTKGYLMGIMSGADVVPAYAISTVGGKTFMVMEWKNGDYIRTGNINYYYVFVKTSNTPAAESFDPNITVTKDSNGVIHESMNYKFVMDEYTVGQWEQIDFVASPDDFDGSNITRQKYIEKGTHNFYDDGRMVSYADKSIGTGETKWTKGYIFNMGSQDTISNYKLRILNGKTFMFVEWKNDDYAVRGQKPNYFVYVKTSDTPDPEFAK